MKTDSRVGVLLVSCALLTASAGAQVSIDFVTIPGPANPADPATGSGAVASAFRIGATEVTSAQYTAFLNAVGAADSVGLYSPLMGGDFTGIVREGVFGSYTYRVREGFENLPVAYISFLDAMRFVNWLHNGQGAAGTPEGETETGAYAIVDGRTEVREADARFFIPSDDEWYKAAYYQPASDGGDADSFWLYPTSSNSVPFGSQANFGASAPRTVASYSANYADAYDMGGNAYEWTERLDAGATKRTVRGGSWASSSVFMQSLRLTELSPGLSSELTGFRVAAQPAGPAGCNPADIAEPFDVLDLADIGAFIDAFVSGDPLADLAPSFGVLDLADVNAFIAGFTAGCP